MLRSGTPAFSRLVSVATIAALALAPVLGGPRLANDSILEIHADALTSYKYSGTSAIQDVPPQVLQRGVRLEGSVRAGAAFPMAFAGNPHEPARLPDAMQQIHRPTGVTEVGRVDYSYYSADAESYGDEGDLNLATVTTPLSDSGVESIRKTYYR
jgi:hypothetical protein